MSTQKKKTARKTSDRLRDSRTFVITTHETFRAKRRHPHAGFGISHRALLLRREITKHQGTRVSPTTCRVKIHSGGKNREEIELDWPLKYIYSQAIYKILPWKYSIWCGINAI